jgi:hypothetical protein
MTRSERFNVKQLIEQGREQARVSELRDTLRAELDGLETMQFTTPRLARIQHAAERLLALLDEEGDEIPMLESHS